MFILPNYFELEQTISGEIENIWLENQLWQLSSSTN